MISNIFLKELWKLFRQNLNSCNGSMDTYSYLMKSKIQQQLLCLINHSKLFSGNSFTVYESGGKTGERLFVPGWETKIFG